MASRHEEMEFGSDSFLDIVANVVGILIILIVIVGIQAAKLPAPPPLAALDPPPAEEVLPALVPEPLVIEDPVPTPLPVFAPAIAAVEEPEVELPPLIIVEPAPVPKQRVITIEKPLPELPSPTIPQELLAQSSQLEAGMVQLAARREDLEREVAVALEQLNAARQERDQTLVSLEEKSSEQAARQLRFERDLQAGQSQLAETHDELNRFKELLAEADREPAPEAIQHRVTPIGRVVSGSEIHFLLTSGGVARVPVDKLAARLKLQIERQKEMFARMDRYEGTVEPIDGFSMQYVIEKARMSLTEELKYGQNLVRMQVSRWTLLPEPDLKTETADQAMQRGSDFYHSLLSAGATTSLTFWVYPDSFETCSQLKEFAHRHGYDVACRPLPAGIPITGSPDGSKSIAQ